MERKITQKLKDWKEYSNGKTALLVAGARRVGKSYIVEEFAKNEYDDYLLIDFSKATGEVKDIFIHYSDDLETFFTMLQGYFQKNLPRRKSVVIFDEVQLFPPARQMIKHLVADGRYDYIETGSLISLREKTKDILIPSEEREIEMYPMDFEEFLTALGAEQTYESMRYFYDENKPLGQALHRKLMTLFRQYIIVGGMPQAVKTFIETKNFKEVDKIKRDILNLYRGDIRKHGGKEAVRIERVFDMIPSQLSGTNKRFMFAAISDDARYREYENALFWLQDAKLVNICHNTTEPSVGLAARMDISAFKCFLCDTGLLISQTFSEKDLAREEIYKKLLFDKLDFNNGLTMENVVAQILVASGCDLYYYSEVEDRMEIDFLLTKGRLTSRKNILPIEVKSGKKLAASSLKKYREKFRNHVDESFILYDGDLKEKDGINYLPLYMAAFIGD